MWLYTLIRMGGSTPKPEKAAIRSKTQSSGSTPESECGYTRTRRRGWLYTQSRTHVAIYKIAHSRSDTRKRRRCGYTHHSHPDLIQARLCTKPTPHGTGAPHHSPGDSGPPHRRRTTRPALPTIAARRGRGLVGPVTFQHRCGGCSDSNSSTATTTPAGPAPVATSCPTRNRPSEAPGAMALVRNSDHNAGYGRSLNQRPRARPEPRPCCPNRAA